MMRNNLATALLLTAVSAFVCNTSYWFAAYVLNAYACAGTAYFTFYLPSCIYTVLIMPVFYFLIRMVRNRTR